MDLAGPSLPQELLKDTLQSLEVDSRISQNNKSSTVSEKTTDAKDVTVDGLIKPSPGSVITELSLKGNTLTKVSKVNVKDLRVISELEESSMLQMMKAN